MVLFLQLFVFKHGVCEGECLIPLTTFEAASGFVRVVSGKIITTYCAGFFEFGLVIEMFGT